jgi:hypothetical protein
MTALDKVESKTVELVNFFDFGAVAKWSNAAVCKTVIRGFKSHPHLQIFDLFARVAELADAYA